MLELLVGCVSESEGMTVNSATFVWNISTGDKYANSTSRKLVKDSNGARNWWIALDRPWIIVKDVD